MKRFRVLIADPDTASAGRIADGLRQLGKPEIEIQTHTDAVLLALGEKAFDLVVLVEPGGFDALRLLAEQQKIDAKVPVVFLADAKAIDLQKVRFVDGLGEILTLPVTSEQLAASALRLLERGRQGAEYELLRRQIERPYVFDDIIGASTAMQNVFRTIEQVANTNVDVLVIGDTGTGKELIARAIHRRSSRAAAPFVPVDCGAIPDNLLESELFGHERGAFTGADSRRIGLLEFADGGTFFLDELGELPPLLQAKLLRTLQERKVRRVGGREEMDVDVRVVAATARDLEAMIRAGAFRQDLYYRINVVQIDLPPLRARGDDIGLLAEHFAHRHGREMGKRILGITPEAYQVLSQYNWPGNVRELQNVIRRGIALAKGTLIGVDDLPDELVTSAGQREPGGELGYFQLRDQHMARYETQYLNDLLTKHRGDVRSAAIEAKLPRGTLYRLMKVHGLDSAQYR